MTDLRWLGGLVLGAALVASVGATQEAPPQDHFHGFSLSDSTWVVVDGSTGTSCHYAPVDLATRNELSASLVEDGMSIEDAIQLIAEAARYCLRGP